MDDAFRHEPSADHPGWMTWEIRDAGRFNAQLGPMIIRLDPDGRARCRIFPERRHSNMADNIHGGVLLAFADIAMFGGARMIGLFGLSSGVTIDCNLMFLNAGRIEEPLDAVVEILRETGRLVFVRGTMEQGARKVAAFSGTLRKPTARAPAP